MLALCMSMDAQQKHNEGGKMKNSGAYETRVEWVRKYGTETQKAYLDAGLYTEQDLIDIIQDWHYQHSY